MNMNEAIKKLVEEMKSDFIRFATSGGRETIEEGSYFDTVIKNFEDNVEIKEGKKYIKILKDRSTWGFVVNTDKDDKFAYGDILKAAGYSAPARNKARGNVFEEYTIRFTGPEYL